MVKTKSVKSVSTNLALLSVFEWTLWLSILLVTVFSWIFLIFSSKLNQLRKKISPQIAPIIWFICLNCILCTFTNLIAINLVQPSKKIKLPFENLQELAEMLAANKCKIILSSICHQWTLNFPQSYRKTY